MSWFLLLKNDLMKERIDNIKGLIAEFDSEVLDMEEKLEQMLEEIYSQVEDLDNKRASKEAFDLTRTDIGRFFLDESFSDLIDYMDAAYEEHLEPITALMEDEMEDEVSQPLLADMPDERIEEILNNAEALLPKIKKEGGEFSGRMIEEYISEARKTPSRARSIVRAIQTQIDGLNRMTGTNLKVD